jgi:hypothetical protein
MTNDQKLVWLIHKTDELIKAQEKAEETKTFMHKDAVKKMQKEIKIWLINNKMVSASAPAVRLPVKRNPNHFNYLAQ